MLGRASLKKKLGGSMALLVTVLIVALTVTMLNIGSGVVNNVASIGETLAVEVKKKQTAALQSVHDSQRASAEDALKSKADNLANIFAKQCGTPMATFDADALNVTAVQIYGDPDVLLCFAEDKSGRVLTSARKREDSAFLQALLKELPPDKRSIKEIAQELQKHPTFVREASMPVKPFADEIGRVSLFVSKERLRKREEELDQTLDSLKSETASEFSRFKTDLERRKNEQTSSALFEVGIIAIVAVLLTVAVVMLITNTITTPINAAVAAAERVARGDLTAKVQANSDDETGLLLSAIQTMTENLNSLVSQVKHSSIQLVSTATGIASNVKQQQATVNDFGSSTTQIAAASKEISATSKELLQTMNDVSTVANDTGNLADSGRGSLREMESTIGQLGSATQSISSKLSVIREKADEINVVVTTITKVADQTNLLSLNAAIEAEKAGEYGLGFSVVAREIRRLADQTAVATLDIEQMVKEMQGAVSAGVMEMDRFSQDVKRGVEEVARIGLQQAKIIERVQTLTPRFKSVNEGMHAQAQGAEQISDAMVQLSDGARRTMATLEEFGKAAENLHGAVNGLKEEVARFKVAS